MDYNLGKRYFSNFNIVLPIFMFIGSLYAFIGFLYSLTFSIGVMLSPMEDMLESEIFIIRGVLIALSLFIGVVATALLVGGILIIRAKAKKRISNEKYEQAIAIYPENLALRARTTLNLPEDEKLLAPAMQFEDYKYHNVSEVKHSNGRVRTDLYEKSVVLLTEKYLYCYSLRFRTTKQENVVNTEMLSYQDIISITLTQKNDTLRRESICIKYLEITTVGGNVIKLPYRYDELAQRDVNIIRRILREKKSATEAV